MPWSKDATALIGIGWTNFTSHSGRSVLTLATQASQMAMNEAGIKPADVDGIITFSSGRDGAGTGEVARALGLFKGERLRWAVDWVGGGEASSGAVALASAAIEAGLASTVLVYRAMNGRSWVRTGGTGSIFPPRVALEEQWAVPYGLSGAVALYAMIARSYMAKYGVRSEQLGHIAVAQRNHAVHNLRAQMKDEITLDDHQNSRWIVEPLHLLDCCPETDGACAVVVTSAERAVDFREQPVYISAIAGGMSSEGTNSRDLEAWESYGAYLAPRLFQQAGITPQDINFAELFDNFTFIPIMQLEDFGFCKKGEGGPFVEEGRTALGGQLPVNTHGGLLSEGYTEGLGQVASAVEQLRGEAGLRQVPDSQWALTTGGRGHSALILRRA